MRFSCDTPPDPGKRNTTECYSATLQHDRITVAVGPLRQGNVHRPLFG